MAVIWVLLSRTLWSDCVGVGLQWWLRINSQGLWGKCDWLWMWRTWLCVLCPANPNISNRSCVFHYPLKHFEESQRHSQNSAKQIISATYPTDQLFDTGKNTDFHIVVNQSETAAWLVVTMQTKIDTFGYPVFFFHKDKANENGGHFSKLSGGVTDAV